ncbi:hypothetical protein CSOJ01_12654 [Colletotrichum sojae]|uniref:Uncharacterized protein n=1 Tax=Colletotrichum sojae TaxID=2175907 RepID=A0A8H6MM28_9PEZI|nr:hypothetical protein CSOJ01_12654 [Colletotrichum sojae]
MLASRVTWLVGYIGRPAARVSIANADPPDAQTIGSVSRWPVMTTRNPDRLDSRDRLKIYGSRAHEGVSMMLHLEVFGSRIHLNVL